MAQKTLGLINVEMGLQINLTAPNSRDRLVVVLKGTLLFFTCMFSVGSPYKTHQEFRRDSVEGYNYIVDPTHLRKTAQNFLYE